MVNDRRPAPRALLVLALALAGATALSIVAIDRPLARALEGFDPSGLWNGGITVLEYVVAWPVHPQAAPVVLGLAMLVAITVRRFRPAAPFWILLAGTHIISRFATGQLKDLTGRLRPVAWNHLPTRGDSFFEGGAAFPSGHVTLFASLALPIALRYPRTRVPLAIVVVFVATARIVVAAHWLSDTLAALALVSLVTYLLALALRPLPARAS